jgi:transcriptional regulator with XRE-family HTH domain
VDTHLTLRTVREAIGKTQADVGEASRIDRGDISRLETRDTLDECQVETLRRYVVALGGELELVAVFGDKKIILTGSSARRSRDRCPSDSGARRRLRARCGEAFERADALGTLPRVA